MYQRLGDRQPELLLHVALSIKQNVRGRGKLFLQLLQRRCQALALRHIKVHDVYQALDVLLHDVYIPQCPSRVYNVGSLEFHVVVVKLIVDIRADRQHRTF